ncbi:g12443 [Coccomyxa viridis]|uniref:G12443 protein n=1 Tax=Coccomyxa viridis TaxID=1274662 RepID=A0ABP1GHD2_9CHLO
MASTAFSAAGRSGSGTPASSGGRASQAQAAAAAASDPMKRLILGGGSAQLNLAAVKARAEELKRSLDQIAFALEHYAHRVQWRDALDKFGVVNVQMHRLSQELRPLLHYYAVHPKAVNAANAPILPIMLSTMALPEMEAEEKGLLSQTDASMAAMSDQELHASLTAREEQLNSLVDHLTVQQAGDPSSGMLDPKGPRLSGMAQQLHAAATAPAPMPLQGPNPNTSQGVRPVRDKRVESLFAAVTKGAGLI